MDGHRLFVVGDRTISRRKVENHGNRVPMLVFQGEIYLSHRKIVIAFLRKISSQRAAHFDEE